jgi:uncharacterized protein (TIGR02145 family)
VKKLLILISFFYTLTANAQDYLITFTGTGASAIVNSVKVENLTAGTILTLNGSDILRLTFTTGINSIDDNQSSELKIYPNPMIDNTTLMLCAPVAGDATISVYSLTGRLLTQTQGKLDKGLQEFRLSGLKRGSYLISVTGNTYQFSGKLLCNSKSDGTINIQKISNNPAVIVKKVEEDSKGIQATVDMEYTAGERLKFTGMSGNYSTVKTDIPVSDKTITFNFIACTDGDNNNYSVVEIDTQVWMAENLKTTRYNDGTAIPNITDNTAWVALTAGAYSDYSNDPVNSTTYGRLYNWFSVDNNAATKVASNGGKNVCPTSWHVPSDAEWTTLTTYLGGESVAAGKLKETGLTHWITPNTGATNETGFTALPGGSRFNIAPSTFNFIRRNGSLWSSTEYSTTIAWLRDMNLFNIVVSSFNGNKLNGCSVRCIRD